LTKRAAFLAKIEGRVQGVGFRYRTQAYAQSLGLVGWVRNEDDGSVTVYCEGPSEILTRFRSWLRKGPTGSLIANVAFADTPPTGLHFRFSIEQ